MHFKHQKGNEECHHKTHVFLNIFCLAGQYDHNGYNVYQEVCAPGNKCSTKCVLYGFNLNFPIEKVIAVGGTHVLKHCPKNIPPRYRNCNGEYPTSSAACRIRQELIRNRREAIEAKQTQQTTPPTAPSRRWRRQGLAYATAARGAVDQSRK